MTIVGAPARVRDDGLGRGRRRRTRPPGHRTRRSTFAVSASGRTPRWSRRSTVIARPARSLASRTDRTRPVATTPTRSYRSGRRGDVRRLVPDVRRDARGARARGRRLGAQGPTVDELREAVPALRKLHRGTRALATAGGRPARRCAVDRRRQRVATTRDPLDRRALMLREGPRLPATAQDATGLGAYRDLHGPARTSGGGVRRHAARRGARPPRRRARRREHRGGRPAGRAPRSRSPSRWPADAHPITRAIVEIAVVDLLAAELWRRADASG